MFFSERYLVQVPLCIVSIMDIRQSVYRPRNIEKKSMPSSKVQYRLRIRLILSFEFGFIDLHLLLINSLSILKRWLLGKV